MNGWSVEFLNETAEAEFDAFPVDIKAKIAHISKLIEEAATFRGIHTFTSSLVCLQSWAKKASLSPGKCKDGCSWQNLSYLFTRSPDLGMPL
ncbi:MAG: hypothetical protein ACQERT_11265 [Thermodesulfobacteriota bacterium]